MERENWIQTLQHLEPTVKDVNTPQTPRVQELCLEDFFFGKTARGVLLPAAPWNKLTRGVTKLSADALFSINQPSQRVVSGTHQH